MSLAKVGDLLYRAEAHTHQTDDGGHVAGVNLDEYVVVSTTACRMRITQRRWFLQPWERFPWEPAEESWQTISQEELNQRLADKGHLVLVRDRDARTKWAWPTRDLAIESLRIRTDRRVGHAIRAFDQAKAVEAYLASTPVEQIVQSAWNRLF